MFKSTMCYIFSVSPLNASPPFSSLFTYDMTMQGCSDVAGYSSLKYLIMSRYQSRVRYISGKGIHPVTVIPYQPTNLSICSITYMHKLLNYSPHPLTHASTLSSLHTIPSLYNANAYLTFPYFYDYSMRFLVQILSLQSTMFCEVN